MTFKSNFFQFFTIDVKKIIKMNNKWRKDYMKQGYKFMSYKIITYILKHIPVVYIFVSVLIICSFLIFSLNSLFNK